MAVRIEYAEDSLSDRWDSFVAEAETATHYHQYAWRYLYRDFFKKQTFYLAALKNAEILGVLPLVRQKSVLFGDYLISLPFVNYGGSVCPDTEVGRRLADSAVGLARKLGVAHIELRETIARPGFGSRTDKVNMILDLPASEGELSKNLGSKRRSQIRRALRETPKVLSGGVELLDLFYLVFSRNMRDLGTPVYPKEMLQSIVRLFPADCTIVVILVHEQPVSAAFLLKSGDTIEVPWASSDRRFNHISVNMMLYWELLRFAIGVGAKRFDFGRSSIDSGTYRFKKQWGALPQTTSWNYWLSNGGELPNLSPSNRKYSGAIRVWKKLPLALANALGPHIVSHLP